MSKHRKSRESKEENIVDVISSYPPWLQILIFLIIAYVFVTALVPQWIIYLVVLTVIGAFIGISYWFYKKKGVNVPKELIKTGYHGYKKIDEDWKKEQEKELKQVGEHTRKVVPVGLQKRLIARAEGKCENCHRSLYNQKIEIHHKNSDPSDNRESNLMVVCGSCHLKLTGPPPMK